MQMRNVWVQLKLATNTKVTNRSIRPNIQARLNVRPDLGPYCLQRLYANDTFMFNAKLQYICATYTCYIPKVSNSLELNQERHSQTGQNVRLDLVPNCLKGYQQMTMSCKSLTQS